jgi:hypothetical protein
MTNHINGYTQYHAEIEKRKGIKPTIRDPLGGIVNTPEWQSAVEALAREDKLREERNLKRIRRKPKNLPEEIESENEI